MGDKTQVHYTQSRHDWLKRSDHHSPHVVPTCVYVYVLHRHYRLPDTSPESRRFKTAIFNQEKSSHIFLATPALKVGLSILLNNSQSKES